MHPFRLSQEQKNLICRRLPRGFTLSRPDAVPRIIKKEPQVWIPAPPPPLPIPVPNPVPVLYVSPPPPPPPPILEEPQIKVEAVKPTTVADLFPCPPSPTIVSLVLPEPPELPLVSASECLDNRPPVDLAVSQTYSVKQESTEQDVAVPLVQTPSSITYSSQQSSLPSLQRENSSVTSQLWRTNSTVSQKSAQVYNIDNTKHKGSERLRMIVGRLRKHKKFQSLTGALAKVGQMVALTRVEEEIKRNCHTLDSFQNKVVEMLGAMKQQPALAELADEFLMFVNQLVLIGRQEEFDGSLLDIQKSVDRITRDLTQIKEQGQWYAKKKKRNDRPIDQKEIIYICDLVRQLPPAYLVGVWEIVNEKPFRENREYRVTEIDFSQLKSRKIREVEYYVKRKLQNIRKSRQQKKQKLNRRRGIVTDQKQAAEEEKLQPQEPNQQEPPNIPNCSEMDIEDPLKDLNEGGNLEVGLDVPVAEPIQQIAEKELHVPVEPNQEEAAIDPAPAQSNNPGLIGSGVMEAEDLIGQQKDDQDQDSSDSSMVTDDQDSAD